jgi:hypothetical protein
MEQHFKVVAILQIVMGLLSISIGLLVLGIVAGAGAFASAMSGNHLAFFITGTVGLVIGALLLLISLPSIIAGIGLLQRREWARMLTIVLSFFHLMHVPFGTIVGAYSLWALFQPDAQTYFV